MDTIFALSSGSPPAGIAVVRISGTGAREALTALAGRLPKARRATAAVLRDGGGGELDRSLILWLPGPGTATGEDTAELHLHGGRAVVAAVETALGVMPGLRKAEPGEFTRRAFANGRIDLAEAEGLGDLLSAETELQRRSAMAMAGGAFSRTLDDWRGRVLGLSARVEAALDFDDEDDVDALPAGLDGEFRALTLEIGGWLERPRAEPLREGFRVALGGPPNSGKSSLFNALLEDEAAIVSANPGTTRDVLERSVAIGGVPFSLVDTAGLRGDATDAVEMTGIERAQTQFDRADLVLWLGEEGAGPPGAWEIETKSDLWGGSKAGARWSVSSVTGEGVDGLKRALVNEALKRLPRPGDAALNARQHALLADAFAALESVDLSRDLLIVGEALRSARVAFDRFSGRASTEDMLDALFGRFCIGK